MTELQRAVAGQSGERAAIDARQAEMGAVLERICSAETCGKPPRTSTQCVMVTVVLLQR